MAPAVALGFGTYAVAIAYSRTMGRRSLWVRLRVVDSPHDPIG
jgi:hypothetical protein